MDIEKRDRMRDLIKRKRELEAELRVVTTEMASLEEYLLDAFAQEGVQNVKLSDGFTLYVQSRLWARPKQILPLPEGVSEDSNEAAAIKRKNMEIACRGLKALGLGEFVTESFNIHSMSGYVRELLKQGEPLPEGFDRYVEVTEDFHILGRKG